MDAMPGTSTDQSMDDVDTVKQQGELDNFLL